MNSNTSNFGDHKHYASVNDIITGSYVFNWIQNLHRSENNGGHFNNNNKYKHIIKITVILWDVENKWLLVKLGNAPFNVFPIHTKVICLLEFENN